MASIIKNMLVSSMASLVVLRGQANAKSLYGELPKENAIDDMVKEHEQGILAPEALNHGIQQITDVFGLLF
jgi:hypothetical protein